MELPLSHIDVRTVEKNKPVAIFKKPRLVLTFSPRVVALLLTAWIAFFLNQALWQRVNELPQLQDPWGLKRLVLLSLLACGTYLWLMLWSWPKVRRTAWSLTLIFAACTQFYMLRYGVMMDSSTVANVLDTNVAEASALLSPAMLGHVAVYAGLPIVWLWLCVRFAYHASLKGFQTTLAWVLAIIAISAAFTALGYQSMAPMVRNYKGLRFSMNPISTLVSWNDVVVKPLLHAQPPLRSINAGANLGQSYIRNGAQKPPLLVLVVGETTRADHFSLNGYERETTPDLARQKVLNWTHASSCGTSTNVSVPCMFSHQDRRVFKRQDNPYSNLLDMFQALGIGVSWLDNQAGCQGVCQRIAFKQADHLASPQAVNAWCKNGECLDRLMLEVLDDQLNAVPQSSKQRGVVLVLHQMGSHGPAYYRRSAKDTKHFLNECENNEISHCQTQALINAYDNSMVETDKFLASTIEWLKKQEPRFTTSMLYVADHGESLGENGIYMHATPYDIAPSAQTHVPWVWWPGSLAERTNVDEACVAQRTDLPISHDNYFHTVLGLMDVHTPYYQPAMDILNPCRQGAPAASRRQAELQNTRTNNG